MAERVVHALEAVEIEHQDRDALATITHASKRLVRLFGEQRTIGKASQRIVARQVGKLGFGPLLRGDVLMNFDAAQITHRLPIDGDDAPVAQFLNSARIRTPARSACDHALHTDRQAARGLTRGADVTTWGS